MSLEAQSINIPLTGGINDAIDEYLVQPGQALVMTNVRNNEVGGSKKRYGTSVVTSTSTSASGATLGSTIRLGTWRGSVVLADDTYLWQLNSSGWSPSTTKLALPRIDHFGVGVGTQAPITAFDILYDSASSSYVVAWQMANTSGQPDIFSAVFDATTGAMKRGVQQVTSTGDCMSPRLAKLTGYYTLTWVRTTGGVVYVSARTAILADFPAGTDITGGTACISPYAMDACLIEGATNELAVVYGKAVGATPMRAVKVTITAGPTVTATSSLNLIDGVAVTIQGIGIQATSGEYLWVAYGLLDGGVPTGYFRALAVNHGAWTAAFATTNIVGGTANLNLTRFAVQRIDATHAFMVGAGGVLGTTPATSLFGGTVSSAAAVTSNAFPGRFTLGSRIAKRSNNTMIAWLTYCPYSALEPGSSILCELPYSTGANTFEQPRPIGAGPMRLVDVSASGYERGPRVTNIETLASNTKYATSVPMLRDLGGTSVAPQAITADYSDTCRSKGVQYGDAYYLSPFQMYDGERLAEVGFVTPPELDSLTDVAGGGNLSAGTYSVKSVYKWMDSRGRVTRSAASPALTVTVSATDRITVAGQILSVSDKQEDDTALTTAQLRYVAIEIYRTEANGTIYYLDQTVTNFKTQTGNTGRFSATISQSDAVASVNAALIEPLARNVAPPSLRSLVVWQNRLCGIGPDGRTIWISSAPADTDQPAWNEAYNAYITDAIQLTAIAVLDEKLVAFSEHRAWVIAGNAPDVNGNNGSLVPQLISSDVGATDGRSVVAFSGGVMFKSVDGLYLLDRGLTMQPVGMAVQTYTDAYPICTSAVLVDRDNELRFTLLADESIEFGTVLVFHITQNEWSVRSYTNAGGDSGIGFATATCAGSTWHASQNGTTTNLQETTASYLDAGSQWVTMAVETPWIKMADIQGFTRCKRAQVLFRPKTAAKLYAQLWADGESSAFYTNTFTEAQVAVGRVEVHIPRQKVEMLKVKFSDVAPVTAGTGQGVEMVALRLLVGIKKGVGKLLPATQKG